MTALVFAALFLGLAVGFALGVAYAVHEHQREDADRARRLERVYRNASRP